MSLYLAPGERPLGAATQTIETDSDIALVAAYLAREMTIEEVQAFAERMERERALRDVVHALEQIWAPPATQPSSWWAHR